MSEFTADKSLVDQASKLGLDISEMKSNKEIAEAIKVATEAKTSSANEPTETEKAQAKELKELKKQLAVLEGKTSPAKLTSLQEKVALFIDLQNPHLANFKTSLESCETMEDVKQELANHSIVMSKIAFEAMASEDK